MQLFVDGVLIGTFSNRAILERFSEEDGIDLSADGVEIVFSPREAKELVRQGISENGGDIPSLLGTASDVASLSLIHAMATVVAEDQSGGDFAKFIEIKHGLLDTIAGDHSFAEIAAQFLGAIQSGEVKIPLMVKGLPKVMEEISERSNAVFAAITQNAEQL